MFKFRSSSQGSAAPAQPLTIEAVRRRARHRLIGACVLVLAGVIGLPLLFDTQPRPIPVDIPIDIPARNAVKPLAVPQAHAPAVQVEGLDTKETAIKDASATSSATGAVAESPVAKVPPTEPARDAQKEVVKEASKETAKQKVDAKVPVKDAARAQALLDDKPVVAGKERVVVQVGAFAEPARAQEVRNKLERAGLKTYTHVAETPQGKRIRVRIGPFENRAQAEKAAQKVKALGLPAAILTL